MIMDHTLESEGKEPVELQVVRIQLGTEANAHGGV